MLSVKQFTFNPFQENTYVIYNEQDECVIIDPGCSSYQERIDLKDYILQSGLSPKYLLNTHCHMDHIYGNQFVKSTYSVQICFHQLELPVLAYSLSAGEEWGQPVELFKAPFHYLNEGDTVRLGQDELSVILTPGHSPGSICFYCSAQSFIVSGDVLFQRSIGRTDLPGGNYDTLINSIRKKLWVLPDEVVVYPGHGPSTTILEEKMENPFLQ